MATLPIIQFTDEGIEKLQYVYFESGSESFIINYTHDEVLKLFRKDFGQSILTPEQIENIRRNKQAKIEAYAQKDLKNPITINYEAFANKKLVGYTLKKAPGRKMHYASELDIRSRIDILKRARDIVLDFHENGIIHGDIKTDNVYFDPRLGVSFLDLDNMKFGDNKADFVNTYVEDYLSKHGTFDETVDAYMFNLMTLEVLDRVPFGTPLLAHLQKADQLPRYRSSQATEIIHDMQKPHPKVKEKYLIDYIKK